MERAAADSKASALWNRGPENRGFLKSRVARRVFVLFICCVLLPLGGLCVFAFFQISSQLQEQAERQLHQASKAAGMTVFERLRFLESDLEIVLASLRSGDGALGVAPRSIRERIEERFTGLTLFDAKSVALASIGRTLRFPALNDEEWQHVAAGSMLIRARRDADGSTRLELVRSVYSDASSAPARDGLLVGEVNPAYLWEGDELLSPGTELVVIDDHQSVLFSTLPEPALATTVLARARTEHASLGRFEWSNFREEFLASYWMLFMQPNYGTNWVIVRSKARAEILEPLYDFRRFFLPAVLLAFLIVAFLSQHQIRRCLVPIEKLRDATQRVAAEDFEVRVQIGTRDEFQVLGDAFNDMVERLVRNTEARKRVELELIEARDEALTAARTEAQFVANVTHELRTPMTSIRAFAEILREHDDTDPGTRREFLDIIVTETDRLMRLIESVLDISALQSGEMTFTFSPVRVEHTLESVVRALRSVSDQRMIDVELDVRGPLPETVADPDRLKQVWTNLISNAIKFSPDGGSVRVRAFHAGEELVVEVLDDGPGLRPEEQKVVFDRFRQISSDMMTSKPSGTGLGLAISKEIVGLHYGRIEIDSEPGRGTTFRVILPNLSELAPLLCTEELVG